MYITSDDSAQPNSIETVLDAEGTDNHVEPNTSHHDQIEEKIQSTDNPSEIMIEIQSTSARTVEDISCHPDEKERLFRPGTHLQQTSQTTKGNTIYIEAQEVDGNKPQGEPVPSGPILIAGPAVIRNSSNESRRVDTADFVRAAKFGYVDINPREKAGVTDENGNPITASRINQETPSVEDIKSGDVKREETGSYIDNGGTLYSFFTLTKNTFWSNIYSSRGGSTEKEEDAIREYTYDSSQMNAALRAQKKNHLRKLLKKSLMLRVG